MSGWRGWNPRISETGLYREAAAVVSGMDLAKLFGDALYEHGNDDDHELMAKVQRDLADRIARMRLKKAKA